MNLNVNGGKVGKVGGFLPCVHSFELALYRDRVQHPTKPTNPTKLKIKDYQQKWHHQLPKTADLDAKTQDVMDIQTVQHGIVVKYIARNVHYLENHMEVYHLKDILIH